ncbi:MAG: dTDP-4-dehydrorhamnose reductase [Candidatus Latescibacterota bacterium]|nr:MAG: dTDP-4-dehydrorhamnose reductase [Candidatus Latescibacterota bacterium]
MNAKQKSITIFGADGQLGVDLCAVFEGHNLEPVVYPGVDIRDRSQVGAVLDRSRPDWVINSAAMTHVDRCEDLDLAAYQVNAVGAKHVAEKCRASGARLIQISTDYVFDGKKEHPYVEDDRTGPVNVYGLTKLAGERFVSNAAPDTIILRTSGLYGTHPCWGKGQNFVDTMLELAKTKECLHIVDDEVLTPTFTEDLAVVVRSIIDKSPPGGIYHATNAGQCSWFEFARTVFELSGIRIRIEKTTAAEWNAPAKRPSYSVLDNRRLQELGLDTMPTWESALERYLNKKYPRGVDA